MHTSFAATPVIKHVLSPSGWSKGKHRIVAPVASFISSSCASVPSHPPRAHFPSAIAVLSSSYEFTSTMLSSRKTVASWSKEACTSSRVCLIFATNTTASTETPNSFPSFPGLSRRATTHAPVATSFGPTSIRIGTPFISQWLNFQPGELRVSSSSFTRTPACFSVSTMCAAAKDTVSLSLFFCAIGTTTTCTGAKAGGRRRPVSSPCVMMIPPISRVLTPQLDWCTYCFLPFSSRKVVSNALAKLSPRLCDVPACRAFLSPIIASMVYVVFAPAKVSTLDFRPTTTGIAAIVAANSAYTWTISIAFASASSGVACAVWP
mmetsp:Transcript_13233/g.43851  ORF Transcript_13233/g.43851 Transcript_13233/m.43851 type:complete len:320 (+) Transcript_13233:290-1249(+)